VTVPPPRRIIGIAGCPGSGKSTLAARFAAEAPDRIVVPMDGFHLAQRELNRIGRADRKGAPDTFDVDGYLALLRRIRDDADVTVYAPRFDRHVEEPIANAIAVEPRHTTVVTEGNYLLHDRDGWERVRPLLDECWYVDCDDTTRTARLIARHIEHGRNNEDAAAWVDAVDEPNARLIRQARHRADMVIRSDGHAMIPIEPDRHVL
jgi:pantothenate kinase